MKKFETAIVEKPSGEVFGQYDAKFTRDTIFINNATADIEVGDCIIRKVPNGKDEKNFITDYSFYEAGILGFGPHYQVKFNKGNLSMRDKTVQNINIHSSGSVQVGNHNTQNIIDSFTDLAQRIESSTATPSEKQEAKSLLSKLAKNPIVVSILGAAVGSIFK